MSKLKSTFSLQHFKTRLGGKESFRWHQRWISHYMRPRTEADQYCSYSRCCRWSEYETFPNSLPEHFKLNSWQTVNICEKLGQISWLPEFRRYIMMFHCSTLSHGWQEYQSLCLPAMCLHPAVVFWSVCLTYRTCPDILHIYMTLQERTSQAEENPLNASLNWQTCGGLFGSLHGSVHNWDWNSDTLMWGFFSSTWLCELVVSFH